MMSGAAPNCIYVVPMHENIQVVPFLLHNFLPDLWCVIGNDYVTVVILMTLGLHYSSRTSNQVCRYSRTGLEPTRTPLNPYLITHNPS